MNSSQFWFIPLVDGPQFTPLTKLRRKTKTKNLGLTLPRPCYTLYIKDICKIPGRPGTESPCLPDSRVISPNPTPKKKTKGPKRGRPGGELFTLYCNSGLFVCLRQLVQVSRHAFLAPGWGTHTRRQRRHLSLFLKEKHCWWVEFKTKQNKIKCLLLSCTHPLYLHILTWHSGAFGTMEGRGPLEQCWGLQYSLIEPLRPGSRFAEIH